MDTMPKSSWSVNDLPDQTGRRIVITGATSGIGAEAARVLAGKNASVIIAARNVAKGEAVAAGIRRQLPDADISVRGLDLTELKSIAAFAGAVIEDFDGLDVLINNAGIMMCPYSKTSDGFEIQMGTNHLGHFALTGHLLQHLKKTERSRIVVLSSVAHRMGKIDFSDLNWEKRRYNARKAYGDSKLANLYFAYELARRLKQDNDNPLVAAAHPGWTRTDLQRHSGMGRFLNPFFGQGVEVGALPTLRAGFDDEVKPGDFFGPAKFLELRGDPIKVKSNTRSHDENAARELWRQSEQLTGISY